MTLWQRYWSSPWTWLVFAASQWWAYSVTVDTDWVRWINFAMGFIFFLKFMSCGNRRWGKPTHRS